MADVLPMDYTVDELSSPMVARRSMPFFRYSAEPARPSSIYIIGSLRNEQVPVVGNALREAGLDAFDDWYGAGPEADDKWQDYENLRGRHYKDALAGRAAQTVFNFDKSNLDRCDACVLILPAGKSGHLEFGYFRGTGKPGYILFDKVPERYDVMYNFATEVFFNLDDLVEKLK